MAGGLLIVHSDPVDGADEAEFNRWYSQVHAPGVVARGAAVSFRRLRASGIPLAPGIPELSSYVCVYEIEAESVDDVRAIEKRLTETSDPSSGTSPTLDRHSVRAAFYLPVV